MSNKTLPLIQELLDKGDGVLTRRGTVWTYPGCPNDPSGTNLLLPAAYVADAVIQAGLNDGTLAAAVVAPSGVVSAVRLAGDGVPVVQAGLAGSAEMGTELRPGARVEADAGAKPITSTEAANQAAAALAAATGKPIEAPKGATPAPARIAR